jgi:2-polyprenyl-6-hydroxyphenyl methylase / 3-demethylubiquinone-9 3-methyltransferase
MSCMTMTRLTLADARITRPITLIRAARRPPAGVGRTQRPGGPWLFDTINRTPQARLATITIAEDVLRRLPRGHAGAGVVAGATKGPGARGIYRRVDLTFGPLPRTAVPCMGIARRPAKGGLA